MKTIVLLALTLISFMGQAMPAKIVSAENPDETKVMLSGNIRDKNSGENLIGVAIYVKELQTGVISDIDGNYNITLSPGYYTIAVSYVGYETLQQQHTINGNLTINFELAVKTTSLHEVIVKDAVVNENTSENEMSSIKMKPEQIKSIPALMGEVDVIKVIQLLPGVQSSGEGLSGFNVRGGGSEQNLILLDDAPVYNASHLMGFFSIFNNDAIKEVKLYKGDIPASNGGRLSSLLDIKEKEGNLKKFEGNGGIGTISSRLTLEGPLVKDKCSFILSGRRSYADLFLPLSSNSEARKNRLYFYDLNAKLSFILNENNRLTISSYSGRDFYAYGKAFGMSWGNSVQSIRWSHIFSKKLLSSFSLINSSYKYRMTLSEDIAGFKWDSKIEDFGVKGDFGYFINTTNTLRFGLSSTAHKFNPGAITQNGNESIKDYALPANSALEHAIYISNEQKVNALLSLDYGLRFSVFQNIGKATIYKFDNNYSSMDSVVYTSGKIFNTYAGLEPRVGVKYSLNEFSSIKANYSRTKQYVNLASNSQGGTPLDIWFPSNPNIKPQLSDQYALGYFRNFLNNKIETSVEVYYKNINNLIDFKDHANLLMNPKLDGELRIGKGRAYGVEFLVRKQEGRLNGWISYTLSKSERKINDINQGNYYPSNYDKTHNVSVVANYEISKRVCFSASWVFITGAAVTLPNGRFEYGNIIIPIYSDRNGSRLPDYHRLDLSLTLKGKDKPGKKIHGEWNFSVYNAYYRKNAFSISFEQSKEDPTKTVAYKVYMFPVIPSVTYNLKF